MIHAITLTNILFTAILAVISVIDVKRRVIPNRLSVGGLVLSLAASALIPRLHGVATARAGLAAAAAGGLVGLGVALVLRFAGNALLRRRVEKTGHGASLGLGDVKLLAFLGAYLGWRGVLPTLLVACLAGALVGAVRKLATGSPGRQGGRAGLGRRWNSGDSLLPFGPFLCLGAVSQHFFDLPGLIQVFITGLR